MNRNFFAITAVSLGSLLPLSDCALLLRQLEVTQGFATARNQFEAKLTKAHPDINVSEIRYRGVDRLPPLPVLRRRQMSLVHGDNELGTAEIRADQGVLSFDVSTDPSFRQLGVNRLLLGAVLFRYPEIEHIPGVMKAVDSENMRILMMNLGTEEADPKGRVLEAFRGIPAYRTRCAFGFCRIDEIHLNLQDQSVAFDVSRGPFSAEEAKVFIAPETGPECSALQIYRRLRAAAR